MNLPNRVGLLFDSIHDVLHAEAWLRERGVWCDLTPTPRPFSSDCGMALEIQEKDFPLMSEWTRRGTIRARRFYARNGEQLRPLELDEGDVLP